MSFIKKRKHGIYYYYWLDKNGKQRAKSLGVSKKQQARVLAQELDMKHAREKLGLDDDKTIKIVDYFENYKEWSYETKSDNWARREKIMLRHWERFFDDRAEETLDDIDLQTIKEYYRHRNSDVSRKTMSMEIGIMKRLLKQAAEDKYKIQDINWKAISKITNRKPEKHFDYFSRDQLNKIFNSDLRYIDYYKVLFYTGLRSVDVSNLKQKNINTEQKVIEIKTKKTKATAVIPIHPEIDFLLDIDRDHVFPDLLKESDRKRARLDLQKYCDAQDWEGYYALHSFRHSFNQHLALNDVDFEARKSFLTHSSSKSTADYTHSNIEKSRELIEKL